MTREQFLLTQADSEHQVRRRVVPMGIIYFLRLAAAFCSVILAVLLYINFATEARNVIFFELAFCISLFVASFVAERASKKHFAKHALKCRSCNGYLIFVDGKKAAESGHCPHCDAQVFEA
jgi:uncharacterized membrane protein